MGSFAQENRFTDGISKIPLMDPKQKNQTQISKIKRKIWKGPIPSNDNANQLKTPNITTPNY